MKIQLFAILQVALLLAVRSSSQTVRRPLQIPRIGLATYSTRQTDVFSGFANQASLARQKSLAAGFYTERRFSLKELSYYNLVFALPTSSGNFGLEAGYAGTINYNESTAGIAYGRGLGDKIDVGVQFNYYAVKIAGYGNAGTVNVEAGAIVHVTEKFQAGIHVFNPVGGRIGKYREEKLAFVYSAGFGYDASEKFYICTAIQKEENQPVDVITGFQYQFLPRINIKGGVASATPEFWFGAGFWVSSFSLDVLASYHPQLGITPGLSLVVDFGKSSSSNNL
ncbi:MAG TPA: hypothetical protein VFS36_02065 [Chitinophagaceae bacterium]|nr:hypothetical protein [Chitinophagaceae bacterium]